MASLPRPRFDRVWEIGCSNGETTLALADRCDALLATDLSARAVALAQARVAHLAHVRVERATHPGDWPEGRFDLIVLAEVGYYLGPDALQCMARRVDGTLGDDGVLVACHWLAPFDEAEQDGEAVHRTLAANCDLVHLFRYRDADVLLDAWSRDGRSVAQQAGLR